jgi:chromosome segregation ATPase
MSPSDMESIQDRIEIFTADLLAKTEELEEAREQRDEVERRIEKLEELQEEIDKAQSKVLA